MANVLLIRSVHFNHRHSISLSNRYERVRLVEWTQKKVYQCQCQCTPVQQRHSSHIWQRYWKYMDKNIFLSYSIRVGLYPKPGYQLQCRWHRQSANTSVLLQVRTTLTTRVNTGTFLLSSSSRAHSIPSSLTSAKSKASNVPLLTSFSCLFGLYRIRTCHDRCAFPQGSSADSESWSLGLLSRLGSPPSAHRRLPCASCALFKWRLK